MTPRSSPPPYRRPSPVIAQLIVDEYIIAEGGDQPLEIEAVRRFDISCYRLRERSPNIPRMTEGRHMVGSCTREEPDSWFAMSMAYLIGIGELYPMKK
jgi:hypothetical protein